METRKVILTGLLAAMTGIGAYIAIPIQPVPFTMQVFVVLLAGVLLGAKYGALSQVVYVLLGLIAPVYAGGASGAGVLFGPTGGYIFGFIAAAFFIGLMTKKNLGKGYKALIRVLLPMLVGVVIIYAGGMLSLHLVLGLGFRQALVAGVIPFIPFDILKAFLAAPLAIKLRNYLD